MEMLRAAVQKARWQWMAIRAAARVQVFTTIDDEMDNTLVEVLQGKLIDLQKLGSRLAVAELARMNGVVAGINQKNKADPCNSMLMESMEIALCRRSPRLLGRASMGTFYFGLKQIVSVIGSRGKGLSELDLGEFQGGPLTFSSWLYHRCSHVVAETVKHWTHLRGHPKDEEDEWTRAP